MFRGGVSGTAVACWTAAQQQVKLSILHQGHDSFQNSSLAQVVPGTV